MVKYTVQMRPTYIAAALAAVHASRSAQMHWNASSFYPRLLSTSDLGERLQHASSRNTALQESNAQLVAKLEEEQVSYMYHLPLTPFERSVNQS